MLPVSIKRMKRKHRNVRRTDNQTVTKRISKNILSHWGPDFRSFLFWRRNFSQEYFQKKKKTVMIKDDEKRKKDAL